MMYAGRPMTVNGEERECLGIDITKQELCFAGTPPVIAPVSECEFLNEYWWDILHVNFGLTYWQRVYRLNQFGERFKDAWHEDT